jgi:hypothetical protein
MCPVHLQDEEHHLRHITMAVNCKYDKESGGLSLTSGWHFPPFWPSQIFHCLTLCGFQKFQWVIYMLSAAAAAAAKKSCYTIRY